MASGFTFPLWKVGGTEGEALGREVSISIQVVQISSGLSILKLGVLTPFLLWRREVAPKHLLVLVVIGEVS